MISRTDTLGGVGPPPPWALGGVMKRYTLVSRVDQKNMAGGCNISQTHKGFSTDSVGSHESLWATVRKPLVNSGQRGGVVGMSVGVTGIPYLPCV